MSIFNSTCLFLSSSVFLFKERIISELSPKQKQVGAIALAIFNSCVVGLMIYRCFLAQKVDPEDLRGGEREGAKRLFAKDQQKELEDLKQDLAKTKEQCNQYGNKIIQYGNKIIDLKKDLEAARANLEEIREELIPLSTPIKIFVKTLMGVSNPYEVSNLETIASLKQKVAQVEGGTADKIRLIFAGKQLEDDKTIKSYKIQKDNVLYSIVKIV